MLLLSLKRCDITNPGLHSSHPVIMLPAALQKISRSSIRTHLFTWGVQFQSSSAKKKASWLFQFSEVKETLLCPWCTSTRTAFRKVNYREYKYDEASIWYPRKRQASVKYIQIKAGTCLSQATQRWNCKFLWWTVQLHCWIIQWALFSPFPVVLPCRR